MDLVQPNAANPVAGRPGVVRKALQRLIRPEPIFSIHGVVSSERSELEAYIARQFDEIYHARITQFMPQLLSMRCSGQYSAVAGLCSAADGPLFIEHYLDLPIEAELAKYSDIPTARRDIIEVGHLVATHRGASQLFFTILVSIAQRAGIRWAVFSATDRVARIIRKMNFVCHQLARSDPARLGNDVSSWGQYYDSKPVVLAVDVDATYAQLCDSLLADAAIGLFGKVVTELAWSLHTVNDR